VMNVEASPNVTYVLSGPQTFLPLASGFEHARVPLVNGLRALPSSSSTLALQSNMARCSNTTSFPSVGSAGHAKGRCKPCAFFHVKGCENGTLCKFCHLCDPGEKKRRAKDKLMKKRKAMQSASTQQHIVIN
jgi:hypothetical protein